MGACCCVSRIIDNDDEAFYSQIAEIEKLKTSDGVVK